MNLIDAFVLGTCGLQVLRGLAGGFIRGTVGLAAWILGALLAWQEPHLLPGLLRQWALWPWGEGAWDRMATVAVVIASLNVVALGLKWLVHRTPLAGVDRVLGAFLGLLTGLMMVSVPLVALAQLPLVSQLPPVRRTLASAWTVPLLAPLIGEVTAVATGWISPAAPSPSGAPAQGRPASGASPRPAGRPRS